MKLNISPFHFAELQKKSYSLDHVYLLQLINQNYDVEILIKDSLKIKNVLGSMVIKGFITDEYKLTLKGSELLLYLETGKNIKLVIKKAESDDFSKWWMTFPGTNFFKHKGYVFEGARALRTSKLECRIKFDKILNEGEYSAEQLIKALEFDVLQKKEESFKTKTNKLTYLQNSLTYLNQRSYEPFIELMIMNIEVQETNQFNGTDI